MPLDEFWNGPMDRLEAYRKAYYMDLHNAGHINGMYIGKAIASCFSDKEKYPEKNMYQEFLDSEKAVKSKQKKSLAKKLSQMGSIKERYLQKLKKEQEKRGD